MSNNLKDIYMKIKNNLPEKFISLYKLLKVNKEYKECIISSSLYLFNEYISICISDENINISLEDQKNNDFILNIAIACFWIAIKFHDDEPPNGEYIQYKINKDWKKIAKEEFNILNRLNFEIIKFMLDKNHPLNIKE